MIPTCACFSAGAQALGKALRGLPRDQIIIATKVGRYGADDFDFSGSRVTASVKESLARLQLEYVDIIQCHDIEFGDLDQASAIALACPSAIALACRVCRADDHGQHTLHVCMPGQLAAMIQAGSSTHVEHVAKQRARQAEQPARRPATQLPSSQ